uniref:Small ribosomal subunit protein bS18m n=1 Tax=Phasianus colchicus TaxID=9054 RepID=A0A669PVC1_PHACC
MWLFFFFLDCRIVSIGNGLTAYPAPTLCHGQGYSPPVRLPRIPSDLVLNTSRDKVSAATLGSLCQGLTALLKMENPYKEPPKKCILCGINVDYKNVQLLSQFVSPYSGRIYGRHITGLCDKKQREISKAIKRAHILGFMPVMFKNPSFLTDPKICNVKY